MFSYKKQKKSSAIIPLTVLAGAAIGSAVTLLFAPQKGSGSRQWLKERAKDLKNLFGTAIMEDLNQDKPVLQSNMHAVNPGQGKDTTVTKATAMVSHLKQMRQDSGDHTEPA
jgi:gas vesicle protein